MSQHVLQPTRFQRQVTTTSFRTSASHVAASDQSLGSGWHAARNGGPKPFGLMNQKVILRSKQKFGVGSKKNQRHSNCPRNKIGDSPLFLGSHGKEKKKGGKLPRWARRHCSKASLFCCSLRGGQKEDPHFGEKTPFFFGGGGRRGPPEQAAPCPELDVSLSPRRSECPSARRWLTASASALCCTERCTWTSQSRDAVMGGLEGGMWMFQPDRCVLVGFGG